MVALLLKGVLQLRKAFGTSLDLTLPNGNNPPAEGPQGVNIFEVSLNISGKFCCPEFAPGLRCSSVPTPRMAMPKTSMYKYTGP
jgi:hypothetical protein